jgi:aminopeptidase S
MVEKLSNYAIFSTLLSSIWYCSLPTIIVLAIPDQQAACKSRANDSQQKLLECVSADGVLQHLTKFQDIANANGGSRYAGSSGYDESVKYVIERLEKAGYYVYTHAFHFDNTDQTNVNVFAETVKGDESQVVMVGAHLDSVPEGPGINDNASGSAALLEVAEQMSNVEPLNKIRFAWWGAEEIGMIGSDEYLNYYLQPKEVDQIALYINIDMIASSNFAYAFWDGGVNFFDNFFRDIIGVEAMPIPVSAASSDQWCFYKKGIPTTGLNTGDDSVKTKEEAQLYGGTVGEPYDPCYHKDCDTMENINYEALDVNTKAISAATLHFAMHSLDLSGATFYEIDDYNFDDDDFEVFDDYFDDDNFDDDCIYDNATRNGRLFIPTYILTMLLQYISLF